MKKFLSTLFLILALTFAAHAQNQPQYTGVGGAVITFAGVPSGSCTSAQLAVNTTNGNLYSCSGGSWSAVTGSASSMSFSGLTSATNIAAAMLVGSGASLGPTGTGTVSANQLLGATVPTIAATTGFMADTVGTLSIRTLVSGDIPNNAANTTGTAATITGALALANTPLTTSQDILYDNAGSLGRLPIVTNGSCLGNSGGVWASLACSGGGGTTTNALTMNNGGAGAASGTTFNGSAAITLSYNSIGAADLALSNLASVAINTSLLPGATATIDLGSSSFAWRNLYYSGSLINTGSGAVTIQGDTGTCTGATGLGTLCFSSTGNRPVYDYNLGGFSSLILASDFPTSAFLLASNGSGLPIAATSTANTLAGFNSGGAAADVTIGSGLSLSGGTLSATGGAPALNAITSPTATNAVSMAGFGWGLTANVAQTVAMLTLTGDNAAEAFPLLSVVQGGTSDTSTPISVVLKNPASAALILEGASGQSGFIFEVENNTPTVLAGIDQNFNLEVESGIYAHNQGNFTMTSEGNSSPIQLRTGNLPSLMLQAGSEVGGTNAAGSNSFMSSDTSTGNAAMATNCLLGSIKAASGATLQTQVNRYCTNLRTTLTNNTATTVMTTANASGSAAGGKISYCVHVDNGTDYQMSCGEVTYAVANKAGTTTTNMGTPGVTSQILTTGTLTLTWAASAANPSVISLNANSSLTPTTDDISWSVENNSDANDITVTSN